jgi:surfactin synthase thioesterase subunit
VFRSWKSAVAPVQVCPVQLPGREGRIRERPFTSMEELVPALIEVLRPAAIPPWGIFGYSLGAGVAFEVVRRLPEAGIPLPCALLVAAAAAPHRSRRSGELHRLDDAAFREALRDLEGTPEEVLEHEELMELLLPTIRADFTIHETHRPGPPSRVDVAVTAFGGTGDSSVPLDDLRAWGEVTSSAFRAVTFPAGHFFLASHGEELLRHVLDALAETAPW